MCIKKNIIEKYRRNYADTSYYIYYRNGRWRSQYLFKPSDGTLNGGVKIDVHYYEDGNVRMQTDKTLSASLSPSATAAEVLKKIAAFEKQYQEDLNGAFTTLSEGTFKSLRRQLPITRQKVEWEKISGYRVRSLFSFYQLYNFKAFLMIIVDLY